ncbi:MAG TPA: enoyl-CoA hydratase-related protein [Xanthobacteraceae bacterium]|nr:enoyl-CoA hydratase-related protein [Xanthobacteraceae bacterium]
MQEQVATAVRSGSTAFTAIRTETRDGVATIALARPERLNAFTAVMHAELRQALDAAEADETVRCVVLTGEGRAFSAGQDLTEERLVGPDGKMDAGARLERDYNPLVERIYAFPKVTIAALNGPTVGASANIALACDILLAARSAYLQEAFARIALVPDAGGTWSLPRIVGAKRALALMLTADQIPADELQRMGLVYKVFDDATFRDEVAAYARRFATGPALAYRLIKEAARVSEANDLKTQLALEANLQRKAGASEDAREGVTAFREKRAPRYNGK